MIYPSSVIVPRGDPTESDTEHSSSKLACGKFLPVSQSRTSNARLRARRCLQECRRISTRSQVDRLRREATRDRGGCMKSPPISRWACESMSPRRMNAPGRCRVSPSREMLPSDSTRPSARVMCFAQGPWGSPVQMCASVTVRSGIEGRYR